MSTGRDPAAIPEEVLQAHADSDKRIGRKFERMRRLPNAKVGDAGQDFVERPCEEFGFTTGFPSRPDGTRSRQGSWDMGMNGHRFELKTASEDVNGSFRFHHIRYHRQHDALLRMGIGPAAIGACLVKLVSMAVSLGLAACTEPRLRISRLLDLID